MYYYVHVIGGAVSFTGLFVIGLYIEFEERKKRATGRERKRVKIWTLVGQDFGITVEKAFTTHTHIHASCNVIIILFDKNEGLWTKPCLDD